MRRWPWSAVALGLFALIGRRQWFIRDDWAFVLTRRAMREQLGVSDWLFTAQDGHWMTPPLLVYWVIEQVFGIDSYWPFLLANMALHVAAVRPRARAVSTGRGERMDDGRGRAP